MKTNISAKYKVLALVPLMAFMTGCVKKHANIVEGNAQNKLLLRDVETDRYHVLDYEYVRTDDQRDYRYLQQGDTVTVAFGEYDKTVSLDAVHSDIYVNRQELVNRKEAIYVDYMRRTVFNEAVADSLQNVK